MNKYRYLLENVVVFALGSVLSKVVLFFLLAIFTKYLTAKEYGDAELIVTTISLIIPILTLSISDATLRFLLGSDDMKSVISNGLFVTILGCVVLLVCSPICWYIESLRTYVPFILALFIANSLETMFFSINKGLEKVKICSLNSLVSVGFLTLLSYVLIVKINLGMYGYLLSIIGAHIACCIFLFISGKIYRYIKMSNIDLSLTKRMLQYSIPFVPSTVAWWINSLSDRYLIVIIIGSSFNGLYSAAAKIPNVISIFTTIFHQAWQLSGIKEYENENYSSFYSNIYSIFSAFIVIFCAVLILLIPNIGSLLFNGEFTEAWRYVPILVMGAVFSGLSGVLSPAYMAAKKTKVLMTSTVIGSIVNVAINLVFLKSFGLHAAAFSTLVSFICVWAIRYYLLKGIVYLNVNIKGMITSVALLLLEVYLVLQTGSLNLISTIVCLLICFLNVRTLKPQIKMVMNSIKLRK